MPLPARDCDYCLESFIPKRVDQRFCPGKDCRKRFHAEFNQSHVHTCWHCGRNHDPEERAFLDVLELTVKRWTVDVPTPSPRAMYEELVDLIRRRRGSVSPVADDADADVP